MTTKVVRQTTPVTSCILTLDLVTSRLYFETANLASQTWRHLLTGPSSNWSNTSVDGVIVWRLVMMLRMSSGRRRGGFRCYRRKEKVKEDGVMAVMIMMVLVLK